MSKGKARCGFCKRLKLLDREGKFYGHGPGPGGSFFCPGSHRTPKDSRETAKAVESP